MVGIKGDFGGSKPGEGDETKPPSWNRPNGEGVLDDAIAGPVGVVLPRPSLLGEGRVAESGE